MPSIEEVERTATTDEIVENTKVEKQQTEPSESVKQSQQTTTTTTTTTTTDSNSSAPTSSISKKKFVIGEESPKDNGNNVSLEENTNPKEMTENHTDTKQNESDDDYVNIKQPPALSNQINSEPQPPQQQPTPKDEDSKEAELSKPTIMTSTEQQHQEAPVITNTTEAATTTTTQRQSTPPVKQPAKFTLSTPGESPESTPILSPSPQNGIHNAYVNPPLLKPSNISGQSPTQSSLIDSYMFPSSDDSYSSEQTNYSHQPRFPPSSSGISRTQQKLLLQRQHFLADDENYLIHPRNQLRLTKVIERINREYAAISLYKDPIIESLQRVWPRYVQEHPEVLDDDFGVGYEDSKEWGVISDHDKGVENIRSNSIISSETLGVDPMTLHEINNVPRNR